MTIAQRTPRQLGTRAAALAALLALALTGCGGGGSKTNYFEPGGTGGTGTGDSTGGTGTDGTTVPPEEEVVSLGAMIDGTFVQGQINVAVDTLSAGGTTEVTVNLIDQNGETVTEANSVAFTSRCAADGTATLETNVATVGGQAVAEYVANGCVGDDEIRATVAANGGTLTAIGSVFVEQEEIGSLEFVGADPTQIALQGTGGDQTSRVSFKLLGEAGGPIAGATLNFSLNATTGDLRLTPGSETAITNSSGEASTIVEAGTVATSVRVTATEESTGISTQSSQLVVSTGIPDQDSVSISASVFNPEALWYDGEAVEITIRAADHFNNPVPDGTAFSFYAEGGSIDPSCTTSGNEGACSVTWRSQNPRPADGRATIFATAIGNESFTDTNSNGLLDQGETFDDLGEAYADENESGDYTTNEFFIDFDPVASPAGWSDADGEYNGVLCGTSTECSAQDSIIVSDQLVIVMSSQTLSAALSCDGSPVGGTITVAGASALCELTLLDEHGNNAPVDTSVSVEVTDGWKVNGTTSYSVHNGTEPGTVGFAIAQDGGTTGTLTVIATTPKETGNVFNWSITL